MVLNKPIVGMAATPDGGGYWLVASDGGVFSLRRRAVLRQHRELTSTSRSWAWRRPPTGSGYWLVASDGGIFSFGDASSTAAPEHAAQPARGGHGRDPDGHGYWLVASDGGIFAFGDASFYGSTGSIVSTSRSSA